MIVNSGDLFAKYNRALDRLHKWRKIFVSWQLGTRADTDGEALALADHRSLTILLRAEVNALSELLIKKGVFTAEEFVAQITEEAGRIDKDMEGRFPGVSAVDEGLHIDVSKFSETAKHLHFPP